MTVAWSTGLDSFLNPQDIGTMFPFDGLTVLFVLIGVALWLGWHAVQIRGESGSYDDAVEMYERISLDRAMFHGGSALIATDEEWQTGRRPAGGHAAPGTPPPGGRTGGGVVPPDEPPSRRERH
ncbi:MAG TPA: hypothetical protein VK919_05240 [Solirubrobacterales bacterium]|nr:hypothetical protein [Solirubrobacterales bacterium]